MSGIGVVLCDSDDNVIAELSLLIGVFTNNEAEYLALIHGLMWLPTVVEDLSEIEVLTDSRLMAMQITNEFRVKNTTLRQLHKTARELLNQFPAWRITHIPRDLNGRADKLATVAMHAT